MKNVLFSLSLLVFPIQLFSAQADASAAETATLKTSTSDPEDKDVTWFFSLNHARKPDTPVATIYVTLDVNDRDLARKLCTSEYLPHFMVAMYVREAHSEKPFDDYSLPIRTYRKGNAIRIDLNRRNTLTGKVKKDETFSRYRVLTEDDIGSAFLLAATIMSETIRKSNKEIIPNLLGDEFELFQRAGLV